MRLIPLWTDWMFADRLAWLAYEALKVLHWLGLSSLCKCTGCSGRAPEPYIARTPWSTKSGHWLTHLIPMTFQIPTCTWNCWYISSVHLELICQIAMYVWQIYIPLLDALNNLADRVDERQQVSPTCIWGIAGLTTVGFLTQVQVSRHFRPCTGTVQSLDGLKSVQHVLAETRPHNMIPFKCRTCTLIC